MDARQILVEAEYTQLGSKYFDIHGHILGIKQKQK